MATHSSKHQLLQKLTDSILIADGAMGTMLYEKGFPYKTCYDELNLSQPDAVQSIHKSYLDAGANIIETNTFGANPIRLKDFGLHDKTEEINIAGAKIAKKTADGKAWVAGSVGPLNKPLEPIGHLTLNDALQAFQRQISALIEGGVDLIILETFSNLQEIRCALTIARNWSDIPVIAQMTFNEDGKTIMGDKPKEVVAELEQLGADIVGVNCSQGPQGILEVIETMADCTNLPLSAMPNAGFPRLEGGRYIYLTTPHYFADYAKKFVETGVNIVGGCCGTTPDHIKAVTQAIAGTSPVEIRPKTTISVQLIEVSEPAKTFDIAAPSKFRDMLGRQFTVSVEIDPPKSMNPSNALNGAQILSQAGVHIINIADSPLGRARMNPSALAHLIISKTGMETVLHLTCRDRNILGLQSELLGAHALGVRHILAVTGDPPSAGDYPFSSGVYELDSIGLVHLIRQLNDGKDLSGKDLGEPTDFTIGVAVNPTPIDVNAELDKLKRKVDAGAQYAFTQPLYQLDTLIEFLNKITNIPIPIFVGILPLRNAKHAEFLHNEVPEIVIPDHIRNRMHKAGDKGLEEGIAIAREFLKDAIPHMQGTYIMPPFNRFQMAVDVIKDLIPDSHTTAPDTTEPQTAQPIILEEREIPLELNGIHIGTIKAVITEGEDVHITGEDVDEKFHIAQGEFDGVLYQAQSYQGGIDGAIKALKEEIESRLRQTR